MIGRRMSALALVGVVSAFFLLSTSFVSATVNSSSELTSATAAMVRLPGHVLPALARATRIKESRAEMRAKGSEPMMLTLVLKHDDQKGFERYLHDVYRRKSADFRHFLTQREIADRFGPSRKDFDDALAYLRKNGFKLTAGSTNRMTITVRGTRREAERAFDAEIGDYRIEDRSFRANEQDPALPREIAAHMESIIGLANLARPRHAVVSTTRILAAAACPIMVPLCGSQSGAASRQTWADTCLSSLRTQGAYGWENNVEALNTAECQHAGSPAAALRAAEAAQPPAQTVTRGAALDGSGQTIGLIEFDSFRQSDVDDYFAYLGFTGSGAPDVRETKVNGGAALGPDEDEVLVDIDTILTLAPRAIVQVYDAPFSVEGTSFQALFNAATGDGAKIISNSWSYCEDQTTPADVQSIDALFQDAALGGITVINAAGDSGNTCLDGSAGIIGVPADSPNATAVGGGRADQRSGIDLWQRDLVGRRQGHTADRAGRVRDERIFRHARVSEWTQSGVHEIDTRRRGECGSGERDRDLRGRRRWMSDRIDIRGHEFCRAGMGGLLCAT
jgi:subtilase family serine protease